MHELANDINGDPVEVPEAARFWRLRRHLGGRGASVVVTNDDNAAVMLPIGASYAEFHDAVRGAAGGPVQLVRVARQVVPHDLGEIQPERPQLPVGGTGQRRHVLGAEQGMHERIGFAQQHRRLRDRHGPIVQQFTRSN